MKNDSRTERTKISAGSELALVEQSIAKSIASGRAVKLDCGDVRRAGLRWQRVESALRQISTETSAPTYADHVEYDIPNVFRGVTTDGAAWQVDLYPASDW